MLKASNPSITIHTKMTDSEDTTAPVSEVVNPPAMSETHQETVQPSPVKSEKMNYISFSIWPPSQRTRDAVIQRLIETLSSSSVLSKRYGTMTSEEASAAAKVIEDQAFSAAGGSSIGADEDGMEVLHVYSKEISKRMLELVKSKGDLDPILSPAVAPTTSATSEEVSSVENESS